RAAGGMAAGVVAAVGGVGLAVAALPAYNGALPGGHAHMGSFALNNLAWVALGVVVGVAMLLAAPTLTRVLAAADAAVAGRLLGPRRRGPGGAPGGGPGTRPAAGGPPRPAQPPP